MRETEECKEVHTHTKILLFLQKGAGSCGCQNSDVKIVTNVKIFIEQTVNPPRPKKSNVIC